MHYLAFLNVLAYITYSSQAHKLTGGVQKPLMEADLWKLQLYLRLSPLRKQPPNRSLKPTGCVRSTVTEEMATFLSLVSGILPHERCRV